MEIIPDEAVASCRDVAVWLMRTACTDEELSRAARVYCAYVHALVPAQEPVRMLRWRRFIRELDTYVNGVSRTGSHSADHLRAIVAENADLLARNYGFNETDGTAFGSTGAASAVAV